TMAMRRPASQLNSDDLPTLGRPTMATTGRDTGRTPDERPSAEADRPMQLIPLYQMRATRGTNPAQMARGCHRDGGTFGRGECLISGIPTSCLRGTLTIPSSFEGSSELRRLRNLPSKGYRCTDKVWYPILRERCTHRILPSQRNFPA